jgi:hypothetical protein
MPAMPFLRLLAMLLLAFTIPVQGLAAVTAGLCMTFGHHDDGAGKESHAHAHDATDAHSQTPHAHADKTVATDASGDSHSSHCGPCSACCASATIAGPPALSFLSSPSHVTYLFSQLPPPGVQPDGLDRPPLAL